MDQLKRFAEVANSLDELGLHAEADIVTEVMNRVSQKYTGEQLVNNQQFEAVKRWQSFLVSKNLLQPNEVDGIFGPRTTQATKAFQQQMGVTIDGFVGPETLAAAQKAGLAYNFGHNLPPQPNLTLDQKLKAKQQELFPPAQPTPQFNGFSNQYIFNPQTGTFGPPAPQQQTGLQQLQNLFNNHPNPLTRPGS